MSPPSSAGLLMYRRRAGRLEVLLAHPGGPFFARKDAGAWTVPKGLLEDGETPLGAARREFTEETGFPVDAAARFVELGVVRTSGGKRVHVWAFEGDADPEALESNPFEMEWPPRSGRTRRFPEVDRVAWLDLDAAADKINRSQRPLLERLREALEDAG